MGKTPRGPRGCGSQLLMPRMSGGSVEASSHQSGPDVGCPVLDKLLLTHDHGLPSLDKFDRHCVNAIPTASNT